MLKNYFTIAIRSLLKNSVYSFINIFGLAVGLACSILIALWVYDEVSFDKFHKNAEHLSQVWINATFDGKINTWQSVPFPSYEDIKEEDSRIINTAVSDWGGDHLLTSGETRITKRGYFVTEEFLEMFQFPLIKGQAGLVLDEANGLVLTESTAKVMFGNEDPINQVIRIDNTFDVKVTGILKDIPENSSFTFDYLIAHKQLQKQAWFLDEGNSWDNYSFQVYVELHPDANQEEVNNNIKDLLVKKGQTDVPREFFLHPLTRWRLHSTFENGKSSGGMIDYVVGFSAIALFIIIIACINFMNLATARSERRAREVGVRKSVGSRRRELVFQFLGESILITAIAFFFSIVIVELALPFYNDLTKKHLFIDYGSSNFWLVSILLIFVTGTLSGSYPAIYLSSFSPVKVLKGKLHVGRSATTPRKVLVVLQFMFATFLIIGTLVVSEQISYTKKRDLGYDQENLITIPYSDEIGKNFKTIRQELLATGAVSSVTKSNSPITEVYSNNFVDWPGKPVEEKVMFITIATELDYTKTMGIKVLEGRDFMDDNDSSSVVINKAAADLMGIEDIIGTEVTFWGDRKSKVIGVIDNVTMGSPYRESSPMFMVYVPEWANAVTLRLEPTSDLTGALAKVEDVFKKNNPAYPFEYTFVDQQFARKFASINLIGTLSTTFALLAILITGLGLFGLAAFTAEQRTKEIGIRKVMGASVTGIVSLISKDFSRLVIIAFILSAPVSWWSMSSFLERYPYRVEFPWWSLFLSGFIALVYALIIVGFQALKAASSNPTVSLRSE